MRIFLPDASSSYFFINEDLAESFNLETNAAALKLLRKTMREKLEPALYRRIKFDYESSAVIIRTAKAGLILDTSVAINELSNVELSDEVIHIMKNRLLSYKRLEKQKWKAGDIFKIVLEDGTFAFGQIVRKSRTGPVCGLFDNNENEIPALNKIINSNFISVLTLTPRASDNHKWEVLGNMDVILKMSDVPEKFNGSMGVGSKSFTDGIFSKLANAYFGVVPWNIFPEDNVFDQLLLPGVGRPGDAVVLSSTDKADYLNRKNRP